ncbi:MAG: amino acid permease [Candidatus Micrarchaeota archaeon]|nr:amino acid permease [Candidatus Micrarchaeota archaeon]
MPGEKKNMISMAVAASVSLGAIIGAGIFVLSGTALALAGSNALIAFLLVGAVALAVGLQSGELGALMPTAKGSSYSYAYAAFGSEIGFITGLMLALCNIAAISVISLGFGSYLASMVGIQSSYAIPFAIVLIIALTIVNIFGISKAAKTDFALVMLKICVLVLFTVAAIWLAIGHNGLSGSISHLGMKVDGLGGIFAASVVIFFAYSGFQTINSFTDRVKGGPNAAAKAIVYSVVISIVLYVVVALAMIMLLPPGAYKVSGDPLSFALKHVGAPRWVFFVVDIGALVATTSASLAMMLRSSRQIYQMGVDHMLPALTRNYDKSKDVAVNGLIISAVFAILLLFAGNIYTIVSISNVGLFISYLMVSFSVVHFRRAGAKPSFKSPFHPYLSIITIITLLAFFAGLPTEALILGITLMLSMLIVYYFMRELRGKPPVKVRLFG